MMSEDEYIRILNEGREQTLKEFNDRIAELLDDLEKLSKIIIGGCPKVNVITEIMSIKKKWKKEVKQ